MTSLVLQFADGRIAPLWCVYSPTSTVPSFVIPVFLTESGQMLFLNGNSGGEIQSFESWEYANRVDEALLSEANEQDQLHIIAPNKHGTRASPLSPQRFKLTLLQSDEGHATTELRVGDVMRLAYAAEGNVTIGTAEELRNFLKKEFRKPLESQTVFNEIEVAEFVADRERYESAVDLATELIASHNEVIAEKWRKFMLTNALSPNNSGLIAQNHASLDDDSREGRTGTDVVHEGTFRMPSKLNLDGTFYPVYRSKKLHFGPKTFECAEQTVMRLMETSTTSEKPGMLLGKVQSGKTRTFISILALAFDNGFDIGIVLSKNSKALIEQTMNRLNDEFREFVEDNDLTIYDIMRAPVTFTNSELESKIVFVAKKQDDNLRRLLDLFDKTCPAMKGRRVLIVDDEADNASIGYTKKGQIIEANKIAAQISDLRAVIPSVSFLQVTATPYSLYLQPNEVEVDNKLSFQPTRPAFTELVPVPPEYVGGDTYFGKAARSVEPTVESLIHCNVDHQELERLKKPDRRSLKLEECLTTPALEGYRAAFVGFLVGGTILRVNGSATRKKLSKLRYSFLLHSEAGREAHAWQEEITKALRDKLRDSAVNNDPTFVSLVQTAIEDLKLSILLASETLPDENVIIEGVRKALVEDEISISKVNSDEDVASLLDHTGQLKLRSPFNWFIGGQVIDRGVTLSNLIGFYYGRRPQKYQQETVLQHSRMYGYRRKELSVTRFYTSALIRNAMFQMEEFDSSLRAAIEGGGDRAVQFIRKTTDGKIVPCSPNKILISTTHTIKPFKRILPIGFQTGFRTGADGIAGNIRKIDQIVEELCGFNPEVPTKIPVARAIEILNLIQPTLHEVEEDDSPQFDWDMARAALIHLSHQHSDPAERGNVLMWVARDRNSSRMAAVGSHAKFIETPDSEKTEGKLAFKHAIEHPILFLLRQKGEKEKGWRDAEFYWPVIRAQQFTPTAIYAADTIPD